MGIILGLPSDGDLSLWECGRVCREGQGMVIGGSGGSGLSLGSSGWPGYDGGIRTVPGTL